MLALGVGLAGSIAANAWLIDSRGQYKQRAEELAQDVMDLEAERAVMEEQIRILNSVLVELEKQKRSIASELEERETSFDKLKETDVETKEWGETPTPSAVMKNYFEQRGIQYEQD